MTVGDLLGLYLDTAAQYQDCAGRMADLQGFIDRRQTTPTQDARHE